MANEFKINETNFKTVIDSYKTDAASIDHSAVDISTPDSKNVMILNYVDMFGQVLNSVNSYQQMIAENISGIETVVSELKEMDDDLQNKY